MKRNPAPLVLLAFLFALGATALAQEAPAAPPPPPESIIQVILHGGPLIVMIWCAILGTSITMVTFVIQNILTLRKEKMAPKALVDSLRNEIAAGNYQGAWETCAANNNYLANVLKGGLERLGRGQGGGRGRHRGVRAARGDRRCGRGTPTSRSSASSRP